MEKYYSNGGKVLNILYFGNNFLKLERQLLEILEKKLEKWFL